MRLHRVGFFLSNFWGSHQKAVVFCFGIKIVYIVQCYNVSLILPLGIDFAFKMC